MAYLKELGSHFNGFAFEVLKFSLDPFSITEIPNGGVVKVVARSSKCLLLPAISASCLVKVFTCTSIGYFTLESRQEWYDARTTEVGVPRSLQTVPFRPTQRPHPSLLVISTVSSPQSTFFSWLEESTHHLSVASFESCATTEGKQVLRRSPL